MDGALQQALGAVPTQIEEILRQEDSVLPAARHLSQRGRLFLAGAGMNAATAKEGALKVKESSYLVAEGFELETMLHGGLQALHPGDLTVPLVVSGPSLDRMGDLMRALSIIGTTRWSWGSGGIGSRSSPADCGPFGMPMRQSGRRTGADNRPILPRREDYLTLRRPATNALARTRLPPGPSGGN